MMKYVDKIDEVCDDRGSGGAWFVYLKPGWRLDDQHCFGEDTKPVIWQTMKDVEPCTCDECMQLLSQSRADERQ
jgi:hypothetical protein